MSKHLKIISLSLLCFLQVFATNADEPKNATPLSADKVRVRALDKVTGHVRELELSLNQEATFEKLRIVARSCRTSLPEDPPESLAFLDVQEEREGHLNVVFSGWMFASSPSVSAMEHPVYDLWVVGCDGAKAPIVQDDVVTTQVIDALQTRPETQRGIECSTDTGHGAAAHQDESQTNHIKAFYEGVEEATDQPSQE